MLEKKIAWLKSHEALRVSISGFQISPGMSNV
jgi:hypothetical protein